MTNLRTARGVLLGLLLGDAIGAVHGRVPDDGLLRAGAGGQLACWTVEGLIRAHVRGRLRGMVSVPSMVQSAYARWGVLRGDLAGERPHDGWLADVPALGEPRGSAPATLAALRGEPRTSAGAHAIVRTLPAGLVPDGAELAAELAGFSHQEPAIEAARVAATMIGGGLFHASGAAQRGLDGARALPRERAVLDSFAPDATAISALTGATYAIGSYPDDVRQAVVFAAGAAQGLAAPIAGALLGAMHGPEALPLGWLTRLELAWPGEVLAQDLVRELTWHGDRAEDDAWWERYPGA